MCKPKIYLIGLGVMGRNLALNYSEKGIEIWGYDLNPQIRDDVRKNTSLEVKDSLLNLLSAGDSSKRRLILLMIPAGDSVDLLLKQLLPLLSEKDCVIDAGNSYYRDTERRQKEAAEYGVFLLGMGISGGESGARDGAAMMVGGEPLVIERIAPQLSKAAALAHDGSACFVKTGVDGSGHFVKMVHNGIEYGVMQLLGECYEILKLVGNISQEEIGQLFSQWGHGELASYLLEISAKVVMKSEGSDYLVDRITAVAGQNGTGLWMVQSALEYGVPIPVLSAAVMARQNSQFSSKCGGCSQSMRLPLQLEWMEDGMKLAILTAYVQGLELLAVASEKEGWELDFTAIVRGWSGGCIIRSQILLFLEGVLVGGSNVLELFQSDLSAVWINNYRKGLQKTVELAHDAAIPVLALSSALSWVDRCKSSGDAMRLIQAQRDYFGNHGFHREDCNGVFHCDWR